MSDYETGADFAEEGKDFTVLSPVIEYPLCIQRLEDDDNGTTYVSKGHHDEADFIHELMIELEEDGTLGWEEEGFTITPNEITHAYMEIVDTREEFDEMWLLCNKNNNGAFPVTYWNN